MNNDNKATFWSKDSLSAKIGLWSGTQIKDFFVPLLQLQANEFIYDIGGGFSPLGYAFLPYIMPQGKITVFDVDNQIIERANRFAHEKNVSKYLTYKEGDVFNLENNNLEAADLVMCQQLLVNLQDPVTALEKMIDFTKTSGRVFCVENINYGAYIHRPDFSWKANLKLSQIWQKLCLSGKFGVDYANTALGANLPQIFQELGLKNVQWQIISSGTNPQPPYTEEFKRTFILNYKKEKRRLKELILNDWAPNTDLTQEELNFFLLNAIESEYDIHAITNDLFLTQWYYPMMAIVGWLEEKKEKISRNITLEMM